MSDEGSLMPGWLVAACVVAFAVALVLAALGAFS